MHAKNTYTYSEQIVTQSLNDKSQNLLQITKQI